MPDCDHVYAVGGDYDGPETRRVSGIEATIKSCLAHREIAILGQVRMDSHYRDWLLNLKTVGDILRGQAGDLGLFAFCPLCGEPLDMLPDYPLPPVEIIE